jgi:hypothetical protein
VGYSLANSGLRAFPATLASLAIAEREDSAPEFAFSAGLPKGSDSDGMSGEECEEKNTWRREEGKVEVMAGILCNLAYLV